jgi:hypothetical protein
MHSARTVLLLAVFLTSFYSFSQALTNETCSYKTEKADSPSGKIVHIEYPCDLVEKPSSLAVAKKFSFNEGQIVLLFQIIRHPDHMDESGIAFVSDHENLKVAFNKIGKVLTIKSVTIDKHQASEIKWTAKSKGQIGDFYTSYLTYFIPMGRDQIQLYYGVHDVDEKAASELLKTHEERFKQLAAKTRISN